MGQEKFIPDEHQQARSFFRLLGPVLLISGVVCIVVAGVDFFTLQPFDEPDLFWLFFVALPLIFIGFVLSGLGYGGSVAKYQSREYAPVAKDTFNYLAQETTSGVKEIANALQQGSASTLSLNCHNCQQPNPMSARFCNDCGIKLVLTCRSCEQENTKDARFCNHCGNSLQ
ncbi:zinc ribbon domain-containing protein [Lysinibacillus sp. NPDC097287]|uniref:zinc ribbon domain-containing protein n=1 Tax=Lysinibacillus sp. NPDC097287 TaxID=3364144 RepID=UPI003805E1F7